MWGGCVYGGGGQHMHGSRSCTLPPHARQHRELLSHLLVEGESCNGPQQQIHGRPSLLSESLWYSIWHLGGFVLMHRGWGGGFVGVYGV